MTTPSLRLEFFVAAAVLALGVGFLGVARGAASRGADTPAPVVVELFSSEGCSSCPPADAYLRALDRKRSVTGVQVLALEFHVDYWDDLGWKDPFSAHEFTERQESYARTIGGGRIFTPELVAEGTRLLDYGDEDGTASALREMAKGAPAHVKVTREGSSISMDATGLPRAEPGDAVEVWLAVTESGLSTSVLEGENRGRNLPHAPVVRKLSRVGVAGSDHFSGHVTVVAEATWKASALHYVVLVQSRESRRIYGAGVAS
jgi:hypothetical protein